MAIPIIDRYDHLIGIISFGEILKKIFPKYDTYQWEASKMDIAQLEENAEEISKLKAEDVMNKRVYTIKEDAKIMAALSKMIVKQVHQLPVINENNKLVGTIYKVDIFDTLFTKYLKK